MRRKIFRINTSTYIYIFFFKKHPTNLHLYQTCLKAKGLTPLPNNRNNPRIPVIDFPFNKRTPKWPIVDGWHLSRVSPRRFPRKLGEAIYIGENRWDIVGSERGGTANGIIGAEIGAELGAKRIVDERIEPRKLAHNLAYLHWPMGIKPLTLCLAVSTRLLGRRKGRGREGGRKIRATISFFFPSLFSLFIAVVDSFVFLRE